MRSNVQELILDRSMNISSEVWESKVYSYTDKYVNIMVGACISALLTTSIDL